MVKLELTDEEAEELRIILTSFIRQMDLELVPQSRDWGHKASCITYKLIDAKSK